MKTLTDETLTDLIDKADGGMLILKEYTATGLTISSPGIWVQDCTFVQCRIESKNLVTDKADFHMCHLRGTQFNFRRSNMMTGTLEGKWLELRDSRATDWTFSALSNCLLIRSHMENVFVNRSTLKLALHTSSMHRVGFDGSNIEGGSMRSSTIYCTNSPQISSFLLNSSAIHGPGLLSLSIHPYSVLFTPTSVTIGCTSMTVDEWQNLSAEAFTEMFGSHAAEYRKQYMTVLVDLYQAYLRK